MLMTRVSSVMYKELGGGTGLVPANVVRTASRRSISKFKTPTQGMEACAMGGSGEVICAMEGSDRREYAPRMYVGGIPFLS